MDFFGQPCSAWLAHDCLDVQQALGWGYSEEAVLTVQVNCGLSCGTCTVQVEGAVVLSGVSLEDFEGDEGLSTALRTDIADSVGSDVESVEILGFTSLASSSRRVLADSIKVEFVITTLVNPDEVAGLASKLETNFDASGTASYAAGNGYGTISAVLTDVGFARSDASTAAPDDSATPIECADVEGFTDSQGSGCSGWNGYSCGDIQPASWGYSVDDMKAIQTNCAATCDLCDTGVVEEVVDCEDDPSFVDAMGDSCTYYEGKDCTVAENDRTFLSMVDVQYNCPKSCGFCGFSCANQEDYCYDEFGDYSMVFDPSVGKTWFKGNALEYISDCPSYAGACKKIKTAKVSLNEATGEYEPTSVAYEFELDGGPIVSKIGPTAGSITATVCADHLALSAADPFSWDFETSSVIQYDFTGGLTRFCSTWKLMSDSMSVDFASGGAVRLISDTYASVETRLDTVVGGVYTVEYKSQVAERRDMWTCEPGLVSYHASGHSTQCENAMKYSTPQQVDVWRTESFTFVATSTATTLTLWGPGASFEYVRVTKADHSIVMPASCGGSSSGGGNSTGG
jgi:hypothetical protein